MTHKKAQENTDRGYRLGRTVASSASLSRDSAGFDASYRRTTWCIMATGVTTMKISSVREFRDHATGLLRSKDPVLVTRRGKLAGIFFPSPDVTLPLELKRELFGMLSRAIAVQIKRRGLREEEVLADFERWRKERRAHRRRR